MRSLSGLGIGLSLVFGFLFLALVAEVYYLLWWKKKKIVNRGVEDEYTSSAREFLDLFCWKKPSSIGSTAFNPREICTSARIVDGSDEAHLRVDSSNKDSVVKAFGGEEGMDVELMRLHNLSGPPRILFTIKEETKEDLESEDGRPRRRTLSDFLLTMESPFSPLSSPPKFTPPLTPLDSYSKHGFNPLFESTTKEEDKKWIWPSPPPKFKFLRDAEEKLYRKTLMEEAVKVQIVNGGLSPGNVVKMPPPPPPVKAPGSASLVGSVEKDGSFVTITVGMSQEKEQIQQQHPSSSPQPQVIPPHMTPPRKPIFSWSPKE